MTEKTNSKTATSGISDSNRAPRQFLATITPAQAMDFIGRAGENTYRAKQLYDWVAKKWITDPASMTNLPASLKEKIKENFLCAAVKIEQDSECADGSRKLLLSLSDGETVECALIPAQDGRMTFCLSTQVGCPVACAFCASGSAGFVRNLHAGEIIEEYLLCCRLTGKAPDNVVIMGVGEPLLNYNNLVEALETICSPAWDRACRAPQSQSHQRWTPGIRNLRRRRQWNLAVSLHAPDDKVRSLLIPSKYRRDIKDIIAACKLHRQATGRLLTFEYVMLAGINDFPEQAVRLSRLAAEADAQVQPHPLQQGERRIRAPLERSDKKV